MDEKAVYRDTLRRQIAAAQQPVDIGGGGGGGGGQTYLPDAPAAAPTLPGEGGKVVDEREREREIDAVGDPRQPPDDAPSPPPPPPPPPFPHLLTLMLRALRKSRSDWAASVRRAAEDPDVRLTNEHVYMLQPALAYALYGESSDLATKELLGKLSTSLGHYAMSGSVLATGMDAMRTLPRLACALERAGVVDEGDPLGRISKAAGCSFASQAALESLSSSAASGDGGNEDGPPRVLTRHKHGGIDVPAIKARFDADTLDEHGMPARGSGVSALLVVMTKAEPSDLRKQFRGVAERAERRIRKIYERAYNGSSRNANGSSRSIPKEYLMLLQDDSSVSKLVADMDIVKILITAAFGQGRTPNSKTLEDAAKVLRASVSAKIDELKSVVEVVDEYGYRVRDSNNDDDARKNLQLYQKSRKVLKQFKAIHANIGHCTALLRIMSILLTNVYATRRTKQMYEVVSRYAKADDTYEPFKGLTFLLLDRIAV